MEVHDGSMVPALQPGDRLLVDRAAYRERSPTVGEIVVLVDPEMSVRWLIKRVAAVGPGQYWTTRTGFVSTGDRRSGTDPAPPPDAIELLDLPGSSIYVTGDAPAARDSRRFGPVPFAAVVGRVYRCYAPADRRREL